MVLCTSLAHREAVYKPAGVRTICLQGFGHGGESIEKRVRARDLRSRTDPKRAPLAANWKNWTKPIRVGSAEVHGSSHQIHLRTGASILGDDHRIEQRFAHQFAQWKSQPGLALLLSGSPVSLPRGGVLLNPDFHYPSGLAMC